ncbi:hypothetical protein LMORI2_09120 [Limnohabitans sp. MORI2]|uniref:hypothetical protein n=1 Tax=Limnohabitans sp. MORI2 TaxID=1751150 RepID=UPI002377469A|nr:hypothetical protein [Limnohabitans sp. MORI2]BDU57930.1 hypothetical protein LMORI2_09120 [Limnohabitans sp. MORI2]
MTEKIQNQGDHGVTCYKQFEVDTLKVTLPENGLFQREIPLPSSMRVTQGNHFSESGVSNTKAVGTRPQMSASEFEPFIRSGQLGYPGYPVQACMSPLQPPVIGATLRESVNRLVREATATTTMTPHTHVATGPIADGYVTQITNWVQRLTPAQLGRCFSMDEVMTLAGLKGRYRDHASVRYTGEALRRCGFKQKRDWTAAGRNKRYWVKETL